MERGGMSQEKKTDPYDIAEQSKHHKPVINGFGREDHYPPIVGEKFDMASCIIYIETVAPLQTTGKCQRIK